MNSKILDLYYKISEIQDLLYQEVDEVASKLIADVAYCARQEGIDTEKAYKILFFKKDSIEVFIETIRGRGYPAIRIEIAKSDVYCKTLRRFEYINGLIQFESLEGAIKIDHNDVADFIYENIKPYIRY